jgi:EmrB/QacA subfamily drug resistance transporter
MRDVPRPALVGTLVAAQLVVMFDSSILNIALPSIASDLHLSATGTAWVVNAYFLAFGGLLLLSGRAADVWGRRRMFLIGAAVLAVGSVLGSVAPNMPVLITARLTQGVGAAMLSPAAMSVILAGFSGAARSRAMSWWGAASAIGGALGVSLGGLLTGGLGWHGALAVTAILAGFVLVSGWVTLPADRAAARRSFDATGASLLTTAVICIVYAVLTAPNDGVASPGVVAAAVGAVGAGVGFVLIEQRSADPVLPLPALRSRKLASAIAVNMLGGGARIACFTIVALLIQQVLRYDAAVAGLAMLPTSLAGFAVSTLILPRALQRLGPERVAVAGLRMLIVAHILFALIESGASYPWRIMPVLILAATGVAFSFTPTTLVIANGAAAGNSGVSSGLASATAQIGGAIGIAVFGAADAAGRSAVLAEGGTPLAAAEAGLGGAHLAAAAVAALAVVIAIFGWFGGHLPRNRSGSPHLEIRRRIETTTGLHPQSPGDHAWTSHAADLTRKNR